MIFFFIANNKEKAIDDCNEEIKKQIEKFIIDNNNSNRQFRIHFYCSKFNFEELKLEHSTKSINNIPNTLILNKFHIEEKISKNEEKISKNEEKISKNEERISKIEERISKNEERLFKQKKKIYFLIIVIIYIILLMIVLHYYLWLIYTNKIRKKNFKKFNYKQICKYENKYITYIDKYIIKIMVLIYLLEILYLLCKIYFI